MDAAGSDGLGLASFGSGRSYVTYRSSHGAHFAAHSGSGRRYGTYRSRGDAHFGERQENRERRPPTMAFKRPSSDCCCDDLNDGSPLTVGLGVGADRALLPAEVSGSSASDDVGSPPPNIDNRASGSVSSELGRFWVPGVVVGAPAGGDPAGRGDVLVGPGWGLDALLLARGLGDTGAASDSSAC